MSRVNHSFTYLLYDKMKSLCFV